MLSIALRTPDAVGDLHIAGWIGFKGLKTSNEGSDRVDDLTKSAFLNRPDLHVETEGEFQGLADLEPRQF